MKINSYYKPYEIKKDFGEELKNGDIVFCRGTNGTGNFYGIYVYGIGVIELENGSSAYIRSKEILHLKQQISYWIIEKKFNNVELVIKEDSDNKEWI